MSVKCYFIFQLWFENQWSHLFSYDLGKQKHNKDSSSLYRKQISFFFTAILFTPSDNRINNYRINNYHIYWASCILWPMHLHLIFKTKGFILWLFKLSAINSLPFLLTSLQIANCNIFYLNKDINKIYTPLSLKSDETVHVKTINNFILSIPQETFYLKDIPQHLTIDYNWLFTSLNSPPIPLDPTKFPYFSENLY